VKQLNYGPYTLTDQAKLLIVVAVPPNFSFKNELQKKFRERFSQAQIEFEDEDGGECRVMSVRVPQSLKFTDPKSGENVTHSATFEAAEQLIAQVCYPGRDE
jgi:hypothetical protein